MVEESALKQTMDSNIKDSYQTFVSSLKNTAKVKSNNRGNGSSTTGLVDAVEPYRQLDGSWAISKRKFKLSNNTRVFFKSMPEETIDGKRVELTKATGFNPKYHRGRN